MEWQELIIDGYGRVLQVLEKALGGLTQDDFSNLIRTATAWAGGVNRTANA